MAARDGQLTTITFATSSFAANLIGLSGPSQTREAIESTVMSTTTAKTYIVATLKDAGEVDIEFEYAGSDTPPIGAVAETITIDWGGVGVGHMTVFTGFMTGHNPTSAMGERMTASATLKISGDITIS